MLSFNKFNIYNVFKCLRYKCRKYYAKENKNDYQVVVSVTWQEYDGNDFGDYQLLCLSIDECLYGDDDKDVNFPFVYERFMSRFIEMNQKFAEKGRFPAWISGYIEMCGGKEAYIDFSIDEYTVKQYIG